MAIHLSSEAFVSLPVLLVKEWEEPLGSRFFADAGDEGLCSDSVVGKASVCAYSDRLYCTVYELMSWNMALPSMVQSFHFMQDAY